MRKKWIVFFIVLVVLLSGSCDPLSMKRETSPDLTSSFGTPTADVSADPTTVVTVKSTTQSTAENSAETMGATNADPTSETSVLTTAQTTENEPGKVTAGFDEMTELEAGDLVFGLPDCGVNQGKKISYEIFRATESDDGFLNRFRLSVGEATGEFGIQDHFGGLFVTQMLTPFSGHAVFLIRSYGEFYWEDQTNIVVYEYGELKSVRTLNYDMTTFISDGGIWCYGDHSTGGYVLGVDENNRAYTLSFVPSGMSPFGLVVDVMLGFPVYSLRYGDKVEWMAEAGDQVVISARDIELMYIETLDGARSGWIRCDWDENRMILADGTGLDLNDAIFTMAIAN